MNKFMFLSRYEHGEQILVNLDNVLWVQKCGSGQHTHTRVYFGMGEDDYIFVAESPSEIMIELLE
tara:strand:+ start:211 stop:405 length:195 start_codon:yes stop_codon:yes gene_type:complete